ncbi:MAG: peptide chain release factor N(5)-glutamine methyltransferase [Anaerolineae bacterium]|nr:peptide chain release factor N(5)-glutamine methyltransferase [Anaerolineae bacterium]
MALRQAAAQFDASGVDSPAATARRLMAHMLKRPREWVIAHDDEVLSAAQLQQFQHLVARVVSREPLAYILGHREFYDLDLYVDARVLIPRPETEMLVELALEVLKQASSSDSAAPIALEIGTGSGAAAIAIAKHLPMPNQRVIATDVSADALAVARLNAERCDVTERITFYCGSLLQALPPGLCQDVVVLVANLPYVTREEIEMLPPEIQAHEPRVALDGGEDGLDLVRELLRQIDRHKTAGTGFQHLRAAFFEVGASQGAACLQAARACLPMGNAKMLKDLAKLDRVLAIRF